MRYSPLGVSNIHARAKSTKNWLVYILHRLLLEIKFRLRAVRLDKIAAVNEISAVIFTVEPSHLFNLCLNSVQSQTLLPKNIEIVRNVSPVSRAAQEGLDRIQTAYYVHVDDDMVLKPSCFQRLYQAISANDNCAQVIMMLKDPIRGKICGIRIYRTAVVQALGFHPLEKKGWDRRMGDKLAHEGWKTFTLPVIVGQHHPIYLPYEVYWKFRFAGEKISYYNTGRYEFSSYFDQLIDYWKRTHDVIALYGLAGLFEGLQSKEIDQPLAYSDREQHAGYKRFQAFIQKYSNS